MIRKKIRFGNFEIPRMRGLEYLLDERKPVTDYLFVNEPNELFSMYFENDFPVFSVPENTDRPYCLFEMKQPDRTIRFFCPARHKNLTTVVWYFYMEILDEDGVAYGLPGQVTVEIDAPEIHAGTGKPRFVEVLEEITLSHRAITA